MPSIVADLGQRISRIVVNQYFMLECLKTRYSSVRRGPYFHLQVYTDAGRTNEKGPDGTGPSMFAHGRGSAEQAAPPPC